MTRRQPLFLSLLAIALSAIVFFRFLMSLPNPEDVDNGDPVAGPTEPTLPQ